VARRKRAAREARVALSISSLAKTRAWRPAQGPNEARERGEDARSSGRAADPIAYQADSIGSDANYSAGEADRSARPSLRPACPAHCPARQAPVRAFTAEARARDAGARPTLAIWKARGAVPGRKTDVSDSQWLSELVMDGLVSPMSVRRAD